MKLLIKKLRSLVRAFLVSAVQSDCGAAMPPVVEPLGREDDASSGQLNNGCSWIPDWKEILGEDWDAWCSLVADGKKVVGRPKVLIATMVGGNSALVPLETVLAVALTLRGAEVHFVICDKKLAACQNCWAGDQETQEAFIENGPNSCDWCYDVGMRSLSQLGLPIHQYGSYLTDDDWKLSQEIVEKMDLSEIMNFQMEGFDNREIIKSAVLRYFGRSDTENEKLVLPVAKRYLRASIVANRGLSRLYDKYDFVHTVCNQGIYVPQGNVAEVASKCGSHLVVWDLGYRAKCFNFCHDRTHAFALVDEPNSNWENMPWTDEMESQIKEYLLGRRSSKFDWLKILTQGEDAEPASIASELGLDSSKPIIGLLTNVLWDAQLCYRANAFDNQLEWLYRTIKYFESRPDLQLLIRVHPAELDGWIKSRQSVKDELEKRYTSLPANVYVIPPESKINTYKAMMNCDSVLIYGTTAGLEMLCMGIPVIVAGEAWIRNKGISTVVNSEAEYIDALDSLPSRRRLDSTQMNRALKYAYHIYFRKMIQLNLAEPQPFQNAPYKIKIQSLANFDRGVDKGLDVICDHILNRTPFIFPAEKEEVQFLATSSV